MSSTRTKEKELRPLRVESLPLQGRHLIEASAGTGKTYTITSLVLRFLVERGLHIEHILAVTFTNAATAELVARVEARIADTIHILEQGEAAVKTAAETDPFLSAWLEKPGHQEALQRLRRALYDMDRASIFTIHGFAQRLLSEHAFETGTHFDLELVSDLSELAQDAVTDFWAQQIPLWTEREFRLLNTSSLYGEWLEVARVALSNGEIPLVPYEEAAAWSQVEPLLEPPFQAARRVFTEQGSEALAVLTSGAVKRNIYREKTVREQWLAWEAYFAEEAAGFPLPAGAEKWTAEKVREAVAKGKSAEHPFFESVSDLVQAAERLQSWLQLRRAELRARLVEFVRARLTEEKKNRRLQAFDDLLLSLRDALRHPEQGQPVAQAICGLFPVALIDEFQDTDPVQYEIFDSVYQGAHNEARQALGLYLIGDPKQSIYAFRGADIFAYLRAARDVESVWSLTTSYRASPRLVAAQNALFEGPALPFLVPEIAYERIQARSGREDVLLDPSGEPAPGLEVWEQEKFSTSELPERTAAELARFLARGLLLEGRPVTPRDLAILTRSNRQGESIQQALRQYGIPAVLYSDKSVYATQEARELKKLLSSWVDVQHRGKQRAALSTSLCGWTARRIYELDESVQILETTVAQFRAWSELWLKQGIMSAFEAFSAETELVPRTLSQAQGERKLTNWRHLLELLHEAEQRQHLGVSGVLRYLEEQEREAEASRAGSEASQVRLESDADAVTITTIHKSKGLEYPIVFLPTLGLVDSSRKASAFRFQGEQGEAFLEVREGEERDESWALVQKAQMAENLRLAYVALTRARHMTVLLVPEEESPKKKIEEEQLVSWSPWSYLVHAGSGAEGQAGAYFAARLQSLSEEERKKNIQSLVERSGRALYWEKSGQEKPPVYSLTNEKKELRAQPLPAHRQESSETNSFSSLTRHATGKMQLSWAAREGRDRDEGVELLAAKLLEQTTGVGDPGAAELSENIVLAEFPRGAGPGEVLHGILERAAFEQEAEEARRTLVKKELNRRGLSSVWAEPVERALQDILQTPLGPEGLSLGQLPPTQRRAEMEFSFPVGSREARLSARRLAWALGWQGQPRSAQAGSLPQEYLEQVAELPFEAWSGFLRGFIDLVFEWRGKLFVVDYKSNYLGASYAEYGPSALQRVMVEHHYYLQAMLYAVAIHRWGQTRIASYSYEEHFGGVFYLFVRGMRPARGASTGVVFLRPEQEAMERLSEVLACPLAGEVAEEEAGA